MTAVEFNYQLTNLQDPLKSFALSLTSNNEEAKDLLQETFLKAIKYRDKFTDHTNLKAWLYTIMKNTFINNYRKKKKGNTIIDQTRELYYINIPQERGMGIPDAEFSLKELEKGINKLEDDYKVPFDLHRRGYKYKEIAEKLAIPIGTVKSRIFLARKTLMKKFKEYR